MAKNLTLVVRPNFKFELGERECGSYSVYLPEYNLTLWKMNCSSLRWVSQDIAQAEEFFAECLNQMFDFEPDEVEYTYKIDLYHDVVLKEIAERDNVPINLNSYMTLRKNFHIPYWMERDEVAEQMKGFGL